MMVKKIVSILFFLSAMMTADAVPMYPHPVKLTQPDGTEITVVGHGDEYCNYLTTQDGYTIVKDEAGYFRYAELKGEKLVATDIVAHEPGMRSATETTYLLKAEKHLAPARNTDLRPLRTFEGTASRSVGHTADDGPLQLIRPNINL